MRQYLKIGDLVLMSFLLALAATLMFLPWLRGEEANTFEVVYARTGVVESYPLDTDGEYVIVSEETKLCVSVSAGAVRVLSSDCRDRICVQSHEISQAGQSIVCAPAGIVIRIVSEEAVSDAISG